MRVLSFACALLALTTVFTVPTAAIKCQNEDSDDVDWWIIYKLPSISSSSDPTAQSGYGYAYIDANSHTLKVTEKQLNTNLDGALASTLAPIYDDSSSDVAYFMYNDEWPNNQTTSSHGHTKGVVAFDSDEGFWLVHSTPRFPNYKADGYSFPAYETTYGQTFLCVSYETDTLNDIGKPMTLNYPWIYDSGGSSSLWDDAPNLKDLVGGASNNSQPASAVNVYESAGGHSFTIFAKNAKWGKALYEDLVAPTLDHDLYVETWMRPAEGSFCRPDYAYDVMNVNQITFDNSSGIVFPETKDHSKWAISTVSNWVCIGGINRMTSQWSRGGGTVCFANGWVWDAFRDISYDHADCSS